MVIKDSKLVLNDLDHSVLCLRYEYTDQNFFKSNKKIKFGNWKLNMICNIRELDENYIIF